MYSYYIDACLQRVEQKNWLSLLTGDMYVIRVTFSLLSKNIAL